MVGRPFIRDTVTIDETLQKEVYNTPNAAGPGPVVLGGRIVRRAPGFSLMLAQSPLIIVADTYDSNGGTIDASITCAQKKRMIMLWRSGDYSGKNDASRKNC